MLFVDDVWSERRGQRQGEQGWNEVLKQGRACPCKNSAPVQTQAPRISFMTSPQISALVATGNASHPSASLPPFVSLQLFISALSLPPTAAVHRSKCCCRLFTFTSLLFSNTREQVPSHTSFWISESGVEGVGPVPPLRTT